MSTYDTMMEHAEERQARNELSRARLRLALRCLSGAAEADPTLFEGDAWRRALSDVASILGQKAEIQGVAK